MADDVNKPEELHADKRGGPPKGAELRKSLSLVTWAWVFGAVWVTATAGAPMTLFARHLGASRFEFGVLAAMPFLASFLSIVSSVIVEHTGRRKLIFLIGLYLQRCLWFAIATIPLLVMERYGGGKGSLAVISFLLLVFLMHCGQGMGGTAWTSWMSDIVPDRVRGKYFSRRRQWGILTAIPTACVVGWYLDRHVDMHDGWAVLRVCSLIFMFSAVFGIVDIASFHFVREPYKAPQRGGRLLAALAEPLRNRAFLWAAGFVAVMTFAMSFMGQFVTLYLIEQVKLNNFQTQIMLLIAPMAAQLLVLPIWGKAADRFGKKPLLILSGIGMILPGLGWSLLTPGSTWLGYIVAAVGAGMWTGIEIANFNLVIEVSGSQEADEDGTSAGSSSYSAVNTIVINIAGCLGGFASGLIAQAMGDWHWKPPVIGFKTFTYYDALFALSALLRLAAVVIFLPHIHEPRARPTREALRFMAGSVYSNLVGVVAVPMRFVTRGRKNDER